MKKLLFPILVCAFAVMSCSKNDDIATDLLTKNPITIGISTTSVSYEPLPITSRASGASNDLLAIQVYEGEIPVAKGLFDDWSAITFQGYTNTEYRVVATMIVDAKNKISAIGDIYALPFNSAITTEMEDSSAPFEGISSSSAALSIDNEVYATPNIDRYYGDVSKSITNSDAIISIPMKRMSFGVSLEDCTEELVLKIQDAPELTLNDGDMAIYSLSNFAEAYSADESTLPYNETKFLTLSANGSEIFSDNVRFQRNRLAKIGIDKINGSVSFEFETPFEEDNITTTPTLRILTFEDSDYKGTDNMLGNSDWSSLIDDVEYKVGGLLYGDPMFVNSPAKVYEWYDEGNTELAHHFLGGSFSTVDYAGGGHAISHYVESDLSKGDYKRQLSVVVEDPETRNGGCNGSRNFAMHFGYIDDSGYGMTENLPQIYFHDGTPRVIDHMYVAPNTYLANCVTNGNGLTDPLLEEGYVNIVAIAWNGDTKIGELVFELANEHGFIDQWTKWDLSSFGKVTHIEFNMTGSSDNGYGFSQPAYFAYDNVAVQF